MLTHKNRLLRFGADLVFGLCRFYGVRVTVLENGPETLASPRDVIELTTVVSARRHAPVAHEPDTRTHLNET